MESLEELNIEALEAILIEETKKKEDLKAELSLLEIEIQKIEQKIEQNEERLIKKLNKKLQHVKASNAQMSAEIQNEEEKIKIMLDEKHQSVQKEKEKLLSSLAVYENQIIPSFQKDIQDFDIKLEKINTTKIQPEEANQILYQLESNVKKRKEKYEENLSILQKQIDILISANSETYQQLQNKLRNSSHEIPILRARPGMTRVNSGEISDPEKKKHRANRSSTNMF